jgi:hypothetical protein
MSAASNVCLPVPIHLGVAWNWQYDQEFTSLLNDTVVRSGMTCYLVGPHNLAETTRAVEAGQMQFLTFLDRASDEDRRYHRLNDLVESSGARILNERRHYERAIDKADTHRDLMLAGLELPFTIILPAYSKQPELSPDVARCISKPFIVKPARGGGGRGVNRNATGWDDIQRIRAQFPAQRVLVQQAVEPQTWLGKRAWFRVYFVCGETIVCWWDDQTHRYAELAGDDCEFVDVAELTRIGRAIAETSRLDFFSSEVALDWLGRYVVIDYVNTPCDMRLQSKHANGVPDAIVHRIAGILAKTTYYHCGLEEAVCQPSSSRMGVPVSRTKRI